MTREARRWAGARGVLRFLVFRPDQQASRADLRSQVQAAVEAANAESTTTHGQDAAFGDAVTLPSPEVLFRISSSGTTEARRGWVVAVGTALEHQHVSGTIERPVPSYPPGPTLTLVRRSNPVGTFYGLRRTDGAPAGSPNPGGYKNPFVTEQVIRVLRRSWPSAAASAYIAANQAFFTQPNTPQLDEVILDVARSGGGLRLWLVAAPAQVTSIQLSTSGVGSAYTLDADATWQQLLDRSREALMIAAEDVDLAFSRLTHGEPDWYLVAQEQPLAPSGLDGLYFDSRSLWTDYVADAYGMQLLTRSHLDKAGDLSDWKVREVASDRYLVEARDLEPWFSGDVPTEPTLERARRDFGAMIATGTLLVEERERRQARRKEQR